MNHFKVFFFTILIGFSTSGNAQISDISKINEQLTERPWVDMSEHQIYGYTITKVFGERPAHQRH